MIDVNADGKVTSWRDYLDTNEPMQQIQAGLERRGPSKAADRRQAAGQPA